MNTEIVTTKTGDKFYIRPDTWDKEVVGEVYRGVYTKHLKLSKDDIVLDAGGNIGTFSVQAARLSNCVLSFEPENDNFNLLMQNVVMNDLNNVKVFKIALVGNNDETREFNINAKKNKGAHSFITKRGRQTVTVDCVNINDVWREHKFNVIKMDVEGAEHELLLGFLHHDKIRSAVIEVHLNTFGKHGIEKLRVLVDFLKTQYKHVTEPDYERIKNHWNTFLVVDNDGEENGN
jgi:FkbM family methyltransferase